MLVVAGAAALGSALIVPLVWGDRARVPATPEFVLLWVLGGAGAIGAAARPSSTASPRSRCCPCVGLAVCLTFAWFSAPDLALTQLAVEVVTVVLFLLGLALAAATRRSRTIRCTRGRARWRRRRDLVLAIAIGSGLAALSYAMLTRQAPQSISPFFIENALPDGGGTNVVNVMLVDFRGLRHARRDHRARHRRPHACSRCCAASGRRARPSMLPQQQRVHSGTGRAATC